MSVVAGKPSSETLDYLLRRRSVKVDHIAAPGPDEVQLHAILSAACRVPDHGKVCPFYFLVFQGDARAQAGDILAEAYSRAEPGARADKIELERQRFMAVPLVVALVMRVRPSKNPLWEQILTCGAAAQNLILSANAQGFAANWLTGWYAYDESVRAGLGLDERDQVAGFFYIGTPQQVPEERERPDLSLIVNEWEKDAPLKKGDEYGHEKVGFPALGVPWAGAIFLNQKRE